MPDTILDDDDATLAFKQQEWRVKRAAEYEWAISSANGDPVGVLRCVTPLGNEGRPVFDLELPGTPETKETEGTDWLSIIHYAINEYIRKQNPDAGGYVE